MNNEKMRKRTRSRSSSKKRQSKTRNIQKIVTEDFAVLVANNEITEENILIRDDIIDFNHSVISHLGYGDTTQYMKSKVKIIHIGYNSSTNDISLISKENYNKCSAAITSIINNEPVSSTVALDFARQGATYFNGDTKPHNYFKNLERIFNEMNGSFYNKCENRVIQLDVSPFATKVKFGKLCGYDKGTLTVPFSTILHERIQQLQPTVIGMSLTKEVITELRLCPGIWQPLIVFEKKKL